MIRNRNDVLRGNEIAKVKWSGDSGAEKGHRMGETKAHQIDGLKVKEVCGPQASEFKISIK